MMSCSSFTPYVDELSAELGIPLLSIDGPMLDRAVESGGVTGVLATLEKAAATTKQELEQRSGGSLEITADVVPQAFEILSEGDRAGHDARVGTALVNLLNKVDQVVLAQISMSGVLKAHPELPKPVLSSGPLAIEALDSLFKERNYS